MNLSVLLHWKGPECTVLLTRYIPLRSRSWKISNNCPGTMFMMYLDDIFNSNLVGWICSQVWYLHYPPHWHLGSRSFRYKFWFKCKNSLLTVSFTFSCVKSFTWYVSVYLAHRVFTSIVIFNLVVCEIYLIMQFSVIRTSPSRCVSCIGEECMTFILKYV